MASAEAVIEAIISYQPESDDWMGLDRLLEDLWATGEPEKGMEALFGVFERFPEQDGYGVFWSILHGLESLPDYEFPLVNSLRRRPTEFNVRMIARILNAGQNSIRGTDGLMLLKEVLVHPDATVQARENAGRDIERHQAPA